MMGAFEIVEKFDVKHCVKRACPKSAPRLAKMLERWGGRGIVLVDGKVHSLVGFDKHEMAEIMAGHEEGTTVVLPDGDVIQVKEVEE